MKPKATKTPPSFRQGEHVGFRAHSWGGKVTKVISYRGSYLYRVAVQSQHGGPVYFTVPAADLYALAK